MQEIVYHTNYKLEESYWWFVARNMIILSLIERYSDLKQGDKLLDVGCGTGAFAKMLSDKYEVLCLDTSPLALDYCRSRGLENLFEMDLKDFPSESHEIKAITMLDVIEHIEDDSALLKTAYDLLPKGAYLISTVPAYQWLWSKHDITHMHFRRYTQKNINALLKQAGFEKIFSTYFNTILFPIGIIDRSIKKILPQNENEPPVNPVSDFTNNLLKKVFLFERNLLKYFSFPFGMSIFTISVKK
jgi:SAM-dependent methyltransferase